MIKWLFKYGAIIFLFNTILLSIKSTIALGNTIFLVLMGMFAFIFLINPSQIKEIIFHRAFLLFLIINLINIVYFLLFHSIIDFEAGKYLLARGTQFSIMSCSIFYNYEYYKSRFLLHIVYAIAFIILVSIVFNPNIFSGRYSGIIWNPNMLASFTNIAFAILLLYKEKKNRIEMFLLFTFLIISLCTGSRGVLAAISLAYLFKYGFSIRNIMYAFLSLVGYIIIINFQLDTSINRFVSQDLLNDRLLQYKYAYETILTKPLFGHGLDKYAYIDPELVPYYLHGTITAHNGYLSLLVQYGLVFGLVIISMIFYQSIKLYFLIDRDSSQLTYFYIVIYGFTASLYESMMTGINEFHTILFWFSFCFLSFSVYKRTYAN